MDKPKDSKTMNSVAIMTMVGFFVTILFVLSGFVPLTGEQGVIVGAIVGYVSGKADYVLGYFFSASHKDKDKADVGSD